MLKKYLKNFDKELNIEIKVSNNKKRTSTEIVC